MRILLCNLVLALSISLVQAQPANDDCANAIDLGTTPICDTTTLYNNIDATPSDVGRDNLPPCFKGGAADNDVWFTFTTTDALEYIFTVQGKADSTINDTFGLFNPEIALYLGGCDTNSLELQDYCASAVNQTNTVGFSADDLLPNTTYLMRINAAGIAGVNNGSFWLCIEEIDDKFRLDEESSTLCSGRVYDTGGPTDNYGNNEDYIFTICPEEDHVCLTLTMGSYQLESKGQGGDYFKIYDGDDTTGLLIGASFDMRDTTNKNGTVGINNAVCQSFSASSGCITILWHTDSTIVAEGFDATWVCSQDSCIKYDSLLISLDPDQIEIKNSIQGRLIDISVADMNCVDSAHATFNGSNADLGLDKGLLLTTGRADLVGRPNSMPNMGFKNDTTGLDLLDSLSLLVYGDTTTTNDGCQIDLEFVPETDVIALEITLGSEEYPECIDDQMTDIMGLFYTTAGYVGDPRLGNYSNIAVVPNDTVDIQISNINPNDTSRWEYYRNMLNSQSIEYDGMVANGNGGQKFLFITQNAEPCQANELIAAIADRGDSLYDSGLFLSNIRCLTPTISFAASTGLPFLIETCNPGEDRLTFTFPRVYEDDTEWDVSFEGSAQRGSDFTWTHGNTITLPAGDMSVTYEIDVIDDGITEGSEIFTIKLSRDWGCGEVELTELEVEIRDRLIAEIETEGQPCKGDTFVLKAIGDLQYLNMEWSPSSLFTNTMLNRVVIIPENDAQIVLTGTIIGSSGCQWTDTFDLNVIDPQIEITALDPTGICQGESVRLEATDNVSGTGRTWSPNRNISDPNASSVVVTPDRTTRYYVKVDTVGCDALDSIDIVVDVLDFPNVIGDTTICAGESIRLASLTAPSNTTSYLWSPPIDLDDPTSPGPIARPGDTTTYRLDAVSENGYCVDSAEVTINVIDIGVEILSAEDTIYICLGDTLSIGTQIRGVGEISWSPANGVIGGTDQPTLVVSPDQTTTYVVTYASDRCTPMDQITVAVDRLPGGTIQIDPSLSPYCKNDSVKLSLDVSGVNLRNASFDWSPNGQIIRGDGTPAITIGTDKRRIYTVDVINGACEATYEVEVDVINFELEFTFDTVCFGDTMPLNSFILNDSITGNYELDYKWVSRNPDGLEILNDTAVNTNAIVRNGADLDLFVTVGSCEFRKTHTIQRSWLGKLELNIDPDSIVANCAEISASLDHVQFTPTATVVTETISWTYTDSTSGDVQMLVSDELNVTLMPNSSGTLRIEFEDSNGCFHSYSRGIQVKTPKWTVPNAFTPNGDAQNDVFRVVFEDELEYNIRSFKIFNRWGQLVHESDTNGWDGRIDGGDDAVSEVYLYSIELEDACGRLIECKECLGDVTLVR